MASKSSVRSIQTLVRHSRCCHTCIKSSARMRSPAPIRQFSTTVSKLDEQDQVERPRWSYTPEQMKAPFHPRIKDPRKAWTVNESPEKVNKMYIKLLGKGGDKVLTDEIKWLAITHKSFDQGRRGFNDRLAFLGKRILFLQATFAFLHNPLTNATQAIIPDPHGRTPFEHPALQGLQNLTSMPLKEILTKERLGRLATSYGIAEVMRWKPRNPANLDGSGRDIVHTAALYAILGAISLQKGGEVANQVARERILKPLGI